MSSACTKGAFCVVHRRGVYTCAKSTRNVAQQAFGRTNVRHLWPIARPHITFDFERHDAYRKWRVILDEPSTTDAQHKDAALRIAIAGKTLLPKYWPMPTCRPTYPPTNPRVRTTQLLN